jgi:hypothetical protein
VRSFLAALALVLAALVGTAALTGYVASQTALSTAHSGRLLSSALQQPVLRHKILGAVVPVYGQLPAALQTELNQLVQDPRFDAAIGKVRIDPHGRVHLSRVRHRLEQELRTHGQGSAADILAAVGGPGVVRLPATVAHDYTAAHRASWKLATVGGVVAVLLALFALLVSPHRRRTLRGVGLAVLVSCAATAVVWWAAPAFVGLASRPVWSALATAAREAYASRVVSTLVPVAIAGGVVLLVSFAVPRPRRR